MGLSVELVAEESPDAIQAQAFEAAKTGDLNALQDALADGAELEARNAPYRDTVLNIAIIKRWTEQRATLKPSRFSCFQTLRTP